MVNGQVLVRLKSKEFVIILPFKVAQLLEQNQVQTLIECNLFTGHGKEITKRD